jgi:hypothetical protein
VLEENISNYRPNRDIKWAWDAASGGDEYADRMLDQRRLAERIAEATARKQREESPTYGGPSGNTIAPKIEAWFACLIWLVGGALILGFAGLCIACWTGIIH